MFWNPYLPATAAALAMVGMMNSMAVWTTFTIQAAARKLPEKNR